MTPQEMAVTIREKIEKMEPGKIEVMNAHQVLQLAFLQNILGVLVTQCHQLEEILKYTKLTDGEKQEARDKDAKETKTSETPESAKLKP